MEMQLTFELSQPDLETFLIYRLGQLRKERRAKSKGLSRLIGFRLASAFWLTVVVGSLLLMYYLKHGSFPSVFEIVDRLQYSPATYIMLAVLVLLVIGVRSNSPRAQAVKVMKQSPDTFALRTMQFLDEHIVVTTPTMEARIKWLHFSRFEEMDAHFLFYSRAAWPTIIPKRVFGETGQLTQFRELCNTRVNAVKGAFPVMVEH